MEWIIINICIIKGNLTKEPSLAFTPGNGTAVCKFTVAVARMKKDDGADYINCVAFGKTAEVIANNLDKGSPILVEGRIKTGSYDNKEGQKVYTTDVIVNRFEFIGGKKQEGFTPVENPFASNRDYQEVNPEDLDGIPF